MTGTRRVDVVGVGNALVDVVSQESDAFLEKFEMVKGSMALIDTERAQLLYDAMAPLTMVSGGSAANTVAGVASFGGRSAFIGAVADDELGEVYHHNLESLGVHTALAVRTGADPTGRCLVIVTPDAERTMNTYLGASSQFGPEDVDAQLVSEAQITYLEGFLWDQPAAKDAFRLAASIAKDAGRKVSLSLSDPFCVERHRESFLDLIGSDVDILFANQAEITALYRTDVLSDAFDLVARHVPVAAITLGEAGAAVVTPDSVEMIAAHRVSRVVDTNGAGDAYAAGFLYGYTHDQTLRVCSRLGAVAAGEVISRLGARAQRSLAELAATVIPT